MLENVLSNTLSFASFPRTHGKSRGRTRAILIAILFAFVALGCDAQDAPPQDGGADASSAAGDAGTADAGHDAGGSDPDAGTLCSAAFEACGVGMPPCCEPAICEDGMCLPPL